MKNRGKIIFIVGLIMMLLSSVVSLYSYRDILKRLEASINHSQGYVETKPLLYPVGSIYLTVTDDTVAKIEAKFGGTWEKFGEGTTIVSVNNDYPINTTGGSVSESYTPTGNNTGMAITMNDIELTHTGGAVQSHTLTIAEMPAHGHSFSNGFTWFWGQTNATESIQAATVSGFWGNNALSTRRWNTVNNTGGGQGHTHGFTQPNKHTFTPSVKTYTNPTFGGTAATISHMQPYITVYMYKRVS